MVNTYCGSTGLDSALCATLVGSSVDGHCDLSLIGDWIACVVDGFMSVSLACDFEVVRTLHRCVYIYRLEDNKHHQATSSATPTLPQA